MKAKKKKKALILEIPKGQRLQIDQNPQRYQLERPKIRPQVLILTAKMMNGTMI